MTLEDWKFINTFAPWLSAIGTLLAVVVSLYLAYTSRRQKLKPTVSITFMVTQGQKEKIYPEYVSLKAINIGHTKVKITNIGWNVGFLKKRTFLQTNPKNIYSSEIPITIEEGEEASWLIDINNNQWIEKFYENTLQKNKWNLWSLKFVVYTSKNKSFYCRVNKSFKDKITEIDKAQKNEN